MRTALIAIGMLVLGAVLSRLFFSAPESSTISAPVVSTEHGPSSPQAHHVESGADSARTALQQDPVAAVEAKAPSTTEVPPRSKRKYGPEVLDLKDCLQDPALNPDGLTCPTPAAEEELRNLIVDLNTRAMELEESRNELVNQIAVSKIAKGLDPKETWGSFPDDQIRYRVLRGELADGKKTYGSTLILVDERPELEEVLTKVLDSKREAREKVKERIAALCVH